MNVRVGSISGLALTKRKNNSYSSFTRKPAKPVRPLLGGGRRNKAASVKRKREMNLTMPSVSLPAVGGFFVRLFSFAFAGATLLAISVGLLAGYRWLTTVNYFALQNVAVSGLERLDQVHVMETAGLAYGKNVLSLNIDKIRHALANDPWVDTASVKRVLPGSLEIAVKERTPVFLALYEGAPYYADANGRLIDKVDPGAFVSLPQIEIEAGMEKHLDLLTRLREMMAANHTPFTFAEVAWVRLSWARGVEVRLLDKDIVVCIGSKNWENNLYRLNLVWADLKKRRELGQVALITAQDDKVWVEKRT